MDRAILIVEDDKFISDQYAKRLSGFRVIQATTLPEAYDLFCRHQGSLTGIIMDGAVGGRQLNTLGLITRIRQLGFRGLIVAASTSDVYAKRMVEAGCSKALNKAVLARQLPGIFEG